MSDREKKKLITAIKGLDIRAHENIFEIILTDHPDIHYSRSGKNILIDLAKLDEKTLGIIEKFVSQYQKHIDAAAERDLFYEKAKISVNDMLDNDYNFETISTKTKN